MTTCPSCNAQNDPGNRFCDQCGTRLSGATAPAATPPAPQPAAAQRCPACGANVLPGEAFCESCGASLQAAPPAPADAAFQPTLPVTPAPTPPAPADAAFQPTLPVTPAPAPREGLCWSCGAAVLPGERFCENCGADLLAAPVAPPPPAVEAVPPPPPPAVEAAPPPPPPAVEAAPPPPPPVVEAAPLPPPPVVEAVPPPPPPIDLAARRTELEQEIARQQQIIGQFEQMQTTFGAATPAAVIAGLGEARAGLARAEADLAALPPPTPAIDPAVVKGLEEEIARQRQIITQFEQMQATFGAATPAAVVTGLNDARTALARAEADLAALGGTSAPVATATSATPPVAPPPPTPPAGPRLVVVDGGQVLLLPTDKTEMTVGREDPVSNIYPEIDLTPYGGEQGGVSRQHARLIKSGGQWMLSDLNSTNYTRLDGVRLEPNKPQLLHDGAKVQFGRVVLTFHT